MEPTIEFSKVYLKIERNYVLSNVNFKVNKGERWAIVGPNGSGKTTILRIVNGYLRPSAGQIVFHGGSESVQLEDVRKKTGFVSSFLDNLLESEDSVLDVVVSGKFGATRLWEIPPYDAVKEAKKLLKQLGCHRFQDRHLADLSQGERQKILIARSMTPEPALLTFDEPCASLDLGAREQFLQGLETIARKNRSLSMIYVTHRIDEIPQVFDHALLLKKGRVLASGLMNQVLTEDNLSKCFGVRVTIKKWKNRFYPVVGG